MAQWEKVLAAKTDELNSPEPTWWKKRSDSYKLSFNPHACAVASECPSLTNGIKILTIETHIGRLCYNTNLDQRRRWLKTQCICEVNVSWWSLGSVSNSQDRCALQCPESFQSHGTMHRECCEIRVSHQFLVSLPGQGVEWGWLLRANVNKLHSRDILGWEPLRMSAICLKLVPLVWSGQLSSVLGGLPLFVTSP